MASEGKAAWEAAPVAGGAPQAPAQPAAPVDPRAAAIQRYRAAPWGSGTAQASYDMGGAATDLAAKVLPPGGAAAVGYGVNLATQAIPAMFTATPGAKAATAGAEALGAAIAPKPEVAALARKAQALDIPIRPDMLTDNKFAKLIGEAFEKIPLSGSRADARQVAFNRALTSQIGGDKEAIRLTPDVFKAAMNTSGEKIGEIAAKTPIKLDAEANALFSAQLQDAKLLPNDISRPIIARINEIKSKAIEGVIPGETFRKLNSEIGAQIRSTANGDFRLALSNLQDDLQSLLVKNIANPADLEALQVARKQYAIGKSLIPLVAKSPVGDISPSALMGAVTNSSTKKSNMAFGGGDMGDLARIGQLFMKEPASSGTAERALVYGGATGIAAIEPTTAAGLYGAANIYNRGGNALTNKLLKLDSLRK